MGVRLTMLAQMFLILTLHKYSLYGNILDDANVRLTLEYLCPGVDICKVDPREDQTFMTNETTNFTPISPCCIGCLCQEDCKILNNCCFPDEPEDMLSSNSSSTFGNGTADTIAENMTLGIVNETYNMTVDRDSTSIDIDLAFTQCMYTRTGTPDINWVKSQPAYRMVASPPPGGCKSNTVCPALTQHNQEATCDGGAVFPWGDLFPVYSDVHSLIFKNELCACCYGIVDYEPWKPFLECDRFIHLPENLSFLQESNKHSRHCNMFFKIDDKRLQMDNGNRCFVNKIETCQSDADFDFEVPHEVNLSQSEIITACNVGPEAPFISGPFNNVYRNVFCAMCSNMTVVDEKCIRPEFIWQNPFKMTYLLDTASMRNIINEGKKTQTRARPTACLRINDDWIEESCREVHCPSGQMRGVDGECTFVSEKWFHVTSMVTVHLKHTSSNHNVLRMLNQQEVTRDDVLNAFVKTQPWPSDWKIEKIFHTAEQYQFDPRMIVDLSTAISRPETLTADMEAAIGLHWTIALNGIDITFEQTIQKYEILPVTEHLYMYQPPWMRELKDAKSLRKIPDAEFIQWELLVSDYDGKEANLILKKLLICEQISLFEKEFSTAAFGALMNSIRADRIMFDLEFEDVENGDGTRVARICLADSQFVLRNEKNGAPNVLNSTEYPAWIQHLLLLFIGACAPLFLNYP